jgi:hypothetical protein
MKEKRTLIPRGGKRPKQMLHCSSGKPHILGSSSTGPQVHSSSTNNERKRTLIQTAMQMERRKKAPSSEASAFPQFQS